MRNLPRAIQLEALLVEVDLRGHLLLDVAPPGGEKTVSHGVMLGLEESRTTKHGSESLRNENKRGYKRLLFVEVCQLVFDVASGDVITAADDDAIGLDGEQLRAKNFLFHALLDACDVSR